VPFGSRYAGLGNRFFTDERECHISRDRSASPNITTMVISNEFVKRLSIEHPIIQGPLGGGPSTPELVAAVSNAGGLGSLGAAYLTPEQIIAAIQRIKSLTGKPFQVNLFAGGWDANAQADPAPILELLAEIHQTLGLPAPAPPLPKPDPFPEQLEAVLDRNRPSSVSRLAFLTRMPWRGSGSAASLFLARPPLLRKRAYWPARAWMQSSRRARNQARIAEHLPDQLNHAWCRL
jgi:hypothetical protein